MRDADPLGDVARIVNVLAGAAGALAMGRRTVVVELQRNADDVVALRLQKRSRRRGVDTAGHGDHDPGVLRPTFEIETVEHGFMSSLRCGRHQWAFPRESRMAALVSGASSRVFRESFGPIGKRGRASLFNIGRIPARQSRPGLSAMQTAILAGRQKKRPRRHAPAAASGHATI